MKEIMNVNVVYNDFSEFEKLNVPVLNKIYLDSGNKTSVPYINLNETYYRILNDKILFSKDQLAKIDYTINTTSLSVEEISELIYQKYLDFCNNR